MNLFDYIFKNYITFIFVFSRLIGLILIAPIFSRKNIPNYTKITFVFFTTLIIINNIELDFDYFNQLEFIIVLLREILIGFLIGFISYLYFVIFLLAGEIIDMQVGFSMVKLFDIQNNSRISIMGNFYYIIALLFFLSINGHHILIKCLYTSFEVIPIGTFTINEQIVINLLVSLKEVFIISFKLSSPILAVIFLTNVFLGILSRTVPQMNVFVIGMPIKILIGLLIIFIVLPIYSTALGNIFSNLYYKIISFIGVY